ncbi:MAG: nucleotidyltransferase domain-containing protein [Chloroflexota bacterium]|nr:nucleotidyltransferase domain-containing protein [Chloroflexota bacterium]
MTILTAPLTTQIALPLDAIVALCQKYAVQELAVFGSVLRDDFRADSDVDFLVVFKNDDYGPWMGKLTDMEAALSTLLRRKVDLIDKRGVEQNRNWIIRKSILESAQVIYES